jgi:hypothetical protein
MLYSGKLHFSLSIPGGWASDVVGGFIGLASNARSIM